MTIMIQRALAFVILTLFAAQVQSADGSASTSDELFFPADSVNLKDFIWEKRPIVVFADSVADPAYIEQMELLERRPAPLIERDVVIVTDTSPDTPSEIRTTLRPRGFMVVILSKEGRVQLRKPFPWDVREITRTIDNLPIRQREIRDSKAAR